MAYRKRVYRGRKRPGMKRRMGMRRRNLRPLVLRKKYDGVKYFTETYYAGILGVGLTAGTGGGWFATSIKQMLNQASYINLFDLGTIIRYDVTLVPMFGDTVYGASPPTGHITIVHNQNIEGPTGFFPQPTNEAQLLQETDARTYPLDGKRKLTFKCYRPKCAITQTGYAATSGANDLSGNYDPSGLGVSAISTQPLTVENRKKTTWLNLNSTDAQNLIFGGIKFWVDNSNFNYQVWIRVYAMFKEQQ